MEGNIILLLIVGIIVLIMLLIAYSTINHKRNFDKLSGYKEKYSIETNKSSKIENEIILERIKRLEHEVLVLRQENIKIIEEYKKNNNLINQKDLKNNSFKPILNYNLFKENNSSIISLYEKGKSKEEIAKVLNKSIREIEMVIKLVK